jgi:hypothetical protein
MITKERGGTVVDNKWASATTSLVLVGQRWGDPRTNPVSEPRGGVGTRDGRLLLWACASVPGDAWAGTSTPEEDVSSP